MRGKIKKLLTYIKTSIKKYLSTNILFMSYIVLSVLISFTLRICTIGLNFNLSSLFGDLVIILLLGSFGYLVSPKNQFKYFFTVLCIFTALGVGNNIYYTFYKSFLSVSLADSLNMVGEVEGAFFDKLGINNLIYFLYPVIMIFIHKKLNKRKYYFEISKTEKGKKMFKGTLISSALFLLLLISTMSASDYSKIVKQWNREYNVQKFGLYIYTLSDSIQFLQPKINTMFGYDTAAREFRKFYAREIKNRKKSTNKYTDVFINKNILMIHAESIQDFLIGLEINGEEVTPNLNKLTKNSLYFSSFYPQISTGTSADTEFTCETSLLPSTSGITFVSYFDRTYEAMPSILSKKGYYTFSMHGNDGNYWNRKVMHANLGYQKFYSEEDFYVTLDNIVGLGLSDKDFFNQAVPILAHLDNMENPYFGTLITLTNHSPFDQLEKYGEFDVTMPYTFVNEEGMTESGIANYLEGTEMGNYIKSSHYADEALGEFFNNLDINGLLDNTVIVLYGDHEAKISKKLFNLLYNYDPVTNSIKDELSEDFISFENYKYEIMKNTPLIIWSKDSGYVEEITDVMGMYDILPTLANMFDFEYKYAMGHDIFGNDEKIVVFPNGNFITNKVYYNSLKGDYITLSDKPIEEGYIDRIKKYADERISVSQNLIMYDLIKNEASNLAEELKNGK